LKAFPLMGCYATLQQSADSWQPEIENDLGVRERKERTGRIILVSIF